MAKFFSNKWTARIRNDITSFKQGPNKTQYEAWEILKGYTRLCPYHGVPTEALLGIFHRVIEEKYHIAIKRGSSGDYGSLTIKQGEQLNENLVQSNQCYNTEYDRTVGEPKVEPKGDDQRIKDFSDNIDKLLLAIKKQVHYVGDFDRSNEILYEINQEGQEEIS